MATSRVILSVFIKTESFEELVKEIAENITEGIVFIKVNAPLTWVNYIHVKSVTSSNLLIDLAGDVIPRRYISDDFEFKLVIDSPSPDSIKKYFSL